MLLPHSRRILKPLVLIIIALALFLEVPTRKFLPQFSRDSDGFVDVFVDLTHVDTNTTVPPPLPIAEQVGTPQQMMPALGKHRYRPDGLLETNADGPHPIYELIARAEQEWASKLERASTTLDDAVAEYKRRYGRGPPKGFDRWWEYAMDNDVQLPDEYDQIYNDLEAFWGLEPADLIAIHEENEKKKDSYTIGKNETSEVEVVTYAFTEGRYNQLIVGSRKIIEMLNDIHEELPPFRMTLSPHDGPNRLTDYGVMNALLQAVDAHTYIDRSALPKTTNIGWVSACSPDSPARLSKMDLDNPPQRGPKKTFIYDHVKTMDPCNHPNLLYHHGQFLSHNYGPTPQSALVPEFTYCSTTIHHNIRIPVPYGWVEDIYPRTDDPEFDDKYNERLMWRGSNTGMFHSAKTRWRSAQRNFLVQTANDYEGLVRVLPSNTSRGERVGEPREVRKARINPATMDIAFGGKPIACAEPVCKRLQEMYPFAKRQSIKEAGSYKYVIDVDGNGWSGRFKRLITSNSMIFKATIYPEWYADRIAPWVHYVPIQVDYSDLHDALVFFRGDGNGDGEHEHLARKIALAGREWSKAFWRKEDLVAYFYRLILEYTRLMSLDREAMTYADSE